MKIFLITIPFALIFQTISAKKNRGLKRQRSNDDNYYNVEAFSTTTDENIVGKDEPQLAGRADNQVANQNTSYNQGTQPKTLPNKSNKRLKTRHDTYGDKENTTWSTNTNDKRTDNEDLKDGHSPKYIEYQIGLGRAYVAKLKKHISLQRNTIKDPKMDTTR